MTVIKCWRDSSFTKVLAVGDIVDFGALVLQPRQACSLCHCRYGARDLRIILLYFLAKRLYNKHMATSGTVGQTVIKTAKVIEHAVRRCRARRRPSRLQKLQM